jgi:integrase
MQAPAERLHIPCSICVTRRFKAVLAAAGLPPQRFHDLRHACASFMLAQGVSPRVVMETLGHSQSSLTMNTYSQVLPALRRDAADRMEDFLAGSSTEDRRVPLRQGLA